MCIYLFQIDALRRKYRNAMSKVVAWEEAGMPGRFSS
jgi:hypothetical protein